MSSVAKITAVGVSGAKYEFQVYPLGTGFKELPGLYMFVHRPVANGQWRLHYVGQTHDFQARIGTGLPSHHKIAAAKRAGATHVAVAVVNGRESDRLSAELDLIQRYKPSLNEIGVGTGKYGAVG